MAKKHKEDIYTAFDRISNRIQFFIATRTFSTYNARLEVFKALQADISAIDNNIVRHVLLEKLKAAGI